MESTTGFWHKNQPMFAMIGSIALGVVILVVVSHLKGVSDKSKNS